MTYIVVAVCTYVFPEVEKTLQKNQPVSLKVSLSILSVPLSSTVKRPTDDLGLCIGTGYQTAPKSPVPLALTLNQLIEPFLGKVCLHGILSVLPTTPSTSMVDVGREAGRKETR